MKKVKVSLRELVDAFTNGSDEIEHYLDIETGNIVMVTEDDSGAIREFEEEAEIEEGEDSTASFEVWLEDHDHPDWQEGSIRDAFAVEYGPEGRFIRVPKEESSDGYSDMEDFAETVQEKHLRDLLEVALNGKGAFRRFKDVLFDYPEERERWFKFSEEKSKERVLEWLADEEIEVEE
jgi:hypothetical protein